MLFHKRLGMMVLGLSFCGTVSTAQAQIQWNPFAKKPADTTVTAEKKTTTNLNPFTAFSSNNTSRPGQSNQPPDTPITEETRRMILEESRNYSVDQRTKVIGQFSKLSDAQARQLLQKMQMARLNQTGNRPGTASVASTATRQPSYRESATAQPTRATANQTRQPSTYNPANESYLAQNATRSTGYSLNNQQRPTAAVQPQRQPSAGLGNQNPWEVAQREYQQQQQQTARPQLAYGQQPTYGQPGQVTPTQYTARSSAPAQNGLNSAPVANNYSQQANPFANHAPVASNDNPFARTTTPTHPNAAQSQYDPRSLAQAQGYPQVAPQQEPVMTISPAGPKSDVANNYVNNYRPVSNSTTRRETVEQAVQTSGIPSAPPRAYTSQELNSLIQRAEEDVVRAIPGQTEAQHQDYITKHVELRMLYLLSGQRDRALTAIPAIGADEQTFWTQVFWGLVGYLDAERYPERTVRTTNTLDQLRKAVQSLQGQANLSVRQAVFCSNINSFGDYTKFAQEEFSPGAEVLIYSELDNFKSERTPEGQFRTVLKSSIKVMPHGSQQPIDEVQYNSTEDVCRSFRQDFMQGFKYRLPQRIAPGAYELMLTVEDQLSGKSATYSLNFLVR